MAPSPRTLLAFLLLVAGHTVLAQCGMTASLTSFSANCPFNSSVFSIHITGGVGPWNVTFQRAFCSLTGQHSTRDITVQTLGCGYQYGTTINVTDANGCTFTDVLPTPPMVILVPALNITYECGGSTGVLRYTGMLYGTTPTTTCSPVGYYNIGGDMSASGSMADDWTQESGTTWRYNTPLPPGTYVVDMFPVNQSAFCGEVQCWSYSFITVGTPPPCIVGFRMQAMLAGALTSATMSDGIRAAGLLPTTEPYTALGYTYVGSPPPVVIAPAQLLVTGNDAFVDWVVLEVRSATTPGTVVYSMPALLQRDGDVVGPTGNMDFYCPLAPGNYHLAIRHRNHLGIMTGTTRALTATAASNVINFRSGSTLVYGTDARVQIGTTWCLRSGDAGGNGAISYSGPGNDRDMVLQAIGGSVLSNTLSNVYDRRDVNLDGSVRYTGLSNDRDVILQSIGGAVQSAVRTQQLP